MPNLLIGLREGLEAGLVVSILLAALRKTAPSEESAPAAPIWLGVLGAISVAGSFAAVLTYSAAVLPSATQDAVGGTLSIIAVLLVTWMVFWMRRTARHLSEELTEQVRQAVQIGSGALALTAFLAVGREGLETTLFLWTAARASGSTWAPLAGAAVGIGLSVLLCWLMFRGAIRLNLGVFFSRTAVALILLSAGILAYGIGDLQESLLLPGRMWVAFDLSAGIPADTWWVTIVSGITELQTRMTVLQVAVWIGYLAIVLGLFLGRRSVQHATERAEPGAGTRVPLLDRWVRAAARRTALVGVSLVVVPAAIAACVIAAVPADAAAETAVMVTDRSCAASGTSVRAGTRSFLVTNRSTHAGEITLDDSADAVVGELETVGPDTTAPLTATLSHGTYHFVCALSGEKASTSVPVLVTGSRETPAPVAITPVTTAELTPANDRYRAAAAIELDALAGRLSAIRSDLQAGRRDRARADWLAAQQDWERIGASYDSFGALGESVDGLPEADQGGTASAHFTGLHRLEYGLWHDQPTGELLDVTGVLTRNVATVQQRLASDDEAGDPTNLPIRAHEILEDALRDHLSGQDDEGSGAAYALTAADAQETDAILDDLAPLIAARSPRLLPTARAELAALQSALAATHPGPAWTPPSAVPQATRERVNAGLGAVLETLAAVPDLLEVPPHA